jgi:putative ABC transport system substrate-binding protein
MRRRDLIAFLGVAATASPAGLLAQPIGQVPRIGIFVGSLNNAVMAPAYRAFLQELRRLGFSEGQNLTAEFWAMENAPSPTALAAKAAQWVRSNVDVIVCLGARPPLDAAVAATRTIPIVFVANNYDPVALGHVKSLANPGGNVTGIALRQPELAEKQVELLVEAVPGKKRLAVMWDSISVDQFSSAERRAKLLGLDVLSLKLEKPPYDFDAAFGAAVDRDAQMLLVLSSPFFAVQRDKIVDLTIRHRLPAMFIFKAYAEAGGLISYGADNVAMYRQSAAYVAKILRGAKPADLPIEQPVRFEFVLNLKTARALGIELPTSTLLRANEVIE